MFELPEYTVLARQMNSTLVGKEIEKGCLGNSPHKFVWYNRSHEEFESLTYGKRIGQARVRGRWLTLDLQPGYRLLLGESGGKVLFHAQGTSLPEKYHLLMRFTDGSALSAMTVMWGAMELYKSGEELERQYIMGMRTTPVDPEFTPQYLSTLVDELLEGAKRSVKSLLTQEQLIPGLGNAIAQDILFKARLHPKHPLAELSTAQRDRLYSAIVTTVHEVTEKGGRNDETDLFGKAGGYTRLMDSKAAGNPCPTCGQSIGKMQYLGGSCYFCSHCQE